MSSFFPFTSDC